MNDDALAAVVAVARLIVARRAAVAPRDGTGSRWALASRLRVTDAAGARLATSAASRWTVAGRFHG